jgi:hypothetical protein
MEPCWNDMGSGVGEGLSRMGFLSRAGKEEGKEEGKEGTTWYATLLPLFPESSPPVDMSMARRAI